VIRVNHGGVDRATADDIRCEADTSAGREEARTYTLQTFHADSGLEEKPYVHRSLSAQLGARPLSEKGNWQWTWHDGGDGQRRLRLGWSASIAIIREAQSL